MFGLSEEHQMFTPQYKAFPMISRHQPLLPHAAKLRHQNAISLPELPDQSQYSLCEAIEAMLVKTALPIRFVFTPNFRIAI